MFDNINIIINSRIPKERLKRMTQKPKPVSLNSVIFTTIQKLILHNTLKYKLIQLVIKNLTT